MRSAETSSGLMSISAIHGCSTTSWLKRTSSCSSAAMFDGLAAAHALERGVNFRALHHAARERGVERRQAERAVLEHFHQLAARAEQQHRAELRVNAAAEDDFVAVASLIIGCTVTPRKCSAPAFFGAGGLDGLATPARTAARPADSTARRRRRSCA